MRGGRPQRQLHAAVRDLLQRVPQLGQRRGQTLPGDVDSLSNLLLDYLDVLLEEGNEHGDAEKVVAAVKHHMFSVPGASAMPRVTRALKGFRKARPPRSRAPIPRAV